MGSTTSLPLTSKKVLSAFFILCRKLPPELVFSVLDHAEYWPSTIYQLAASDALSVTDGDELILRINAHAEKVARGGTGHIYGGIHPFRKIRITIKIHDQGWSGFPIDHNTYQNSWTWVDLYHRRILRKRSSLLIAPPIRRCLVQRNLHASSKARVYTIEWRWTDPFIPPDESDANQGGEDEGDFTGTRSRPRKAEIRERSLSFSGENSSGEGASKQEATQLREIDGQGMEGGQIIRELREGDTLDLVASARYAGWRCFVEDAKMEIFWAL